ncbi:MAG TPA: diacylglycerol kinase family protein [Stellaceae bacterium]|nr:diacylglycerol kinase family protein [Stellaceae bacterium]
MDGRILVVMNARSGRLSLRQKMTELRDALSRHGLGPEIRIVRRGGQIAEAVADGVRAGFDTIVVGGGDGTLCAAVAHLADTGRRLGVLPLGTFNYFARSLGIPPTIAGAVAVLAQGHEQCVSIGEVNGKVFLNNASLGIYARVLEQRERLYGSWGRSRLAAHLSVLLGLARARAPLLLRVTVDGATRRRRTPMVFVANNSFQLAEFGLAGAECLEQGRLALYVAPDCGRLALLALASRLVLGRLRAARDFELFCGAEIVVETNRPRRHVVRDGERERLPGPYRFRRRRDALRVLTPLPG